MRPNAASALLTSRNELSSSVLNKLVDRGPSCYAPFRKSKLRKMIPGGVPSNSFARNL
jgi:hypothetical protein